MGEIEIRGFRLAARHAEGEPLGPLGQAHQPLGRDTLGLGLEIHHHPVA
jgi:hypothetical protein